GLIMFYSGDDMMNMYEVWTVNPWRLARAEFMPWIPLYRPLGGAVYRVFYGIFGFHPAPLYLFCWLLLAGNAILAYRFFRAITASVIQSLLALSLTLVHGSFQDLYTSAGTIYDRLWFLFTVLGIAVYAQARKKQESISLRTAVLVCLCCILSMDSKESGVALPLLLASYEAVFVLPRVWRRKRLPQWLRSIGPLYVTLAALSLTFVLLRVRREPELTTNGMYRPHLDLAVWFTRISEYFTTLAYHHLKFSPQAAGLVVVLAAAAALLLRNQSMIFGWLFFVITITPVALIAARPGYVLYVPVLGLGLYGAALIGITASRLSPAATAAIFAAVTIAVALLHAREWPPPPDPQLSPEFRLTEQFRREYPRLRQGSELLFVTDEFPRDAYDLLFNLRLLYHDHSIRAWRLAAPSDQQPPENPPEYDHIFTFASERYEALDTRDPARAIRLHILRDYGVGRQMDTARRDSAAYVVSGVMDGDPSNQTRWTAPRAQLKFDVYPAPAEFSLKFWAPDFVTRSGNRTLSILVNGKAVGALLLRQDGMNEVSFPVPADLISPSDYTLVDLNVDNPYKDAGGTAYGIVLLRAGFDYVTQH
ncbi:MAG TPA: hypothetical protein VHB50_23550, partial [Bryobacteraceae bacterium]|nr:hypothetical protein [Bryobacteraceae bacterium]